MVNVFFLYDVGEVVYQLRRILWVRVVDSSLADERFLDGLLEEWFCYVLYHCGAVLAPKDRLTDYPPDLVSLLHQEYQRLEPQLHRLFWVSDDFKSREANVKLEGTDLVLRYSVYPGE